MLPLKEIVLNYLEMLELLLKDNCLYKKLKRHRKLYISCRFSLILLLILDIKHFSRET